MLSIIISKLKTMVKNNFLYKFPTYNPVLIILINKSTVSMQRFHPIKSLDITFFFYPSTQFHSSTT